MENRQPETNTLVLRRVGKTVQKRKLSEGERQTAVIASPEPIRRRLRACDAAVAVLRENEEPSVMYGDEWLCHQIAKRLGWEHQGPKTTRRVLAAIARNPGPLKASKVKMPSDCCARGQWVMCFELDTGTAAEVAGSQARGSGTSEGNISKSNCRV